MGWKLASWFSKSETETAPTGGEAPTRSDRERCWEKRDVYYRCLDAEGVLVPGKESGQACSLEREEFGQNCAKSWIVHFNQRRVLEEQMKEKYGTVRQGS